MIRRVLTVVSLLVLVVLTTVQAADKQTDWFPKIERGAGSFRTSGMLLAFNLFNPATADTDIVHSLYTCSSLQDTTYTFTANESAQIGTATIAVRGSTTKTITMARNIVLTISGTAANVDVGDATLTGTDILGATLTETFSFTENTAGALTGSKAFASLTSLVVHQQDGANVKVSVGTGNKLQMPLCLPMQNGVRDAWVSGTYETTAPTTAGDADVLSSNTIDFNTDPNGSRDYMFVVWVPPYSGTAAAGIY